MSKTKVAVIFGGISTEHDVSVVSGTSVIQKLNKEQYEIYPTYIDTDGAWYQYEKTIEGIKGDKMRKKIKIFILLIVIILLCVISFLLFSNNDEEIKAIKSDKQLSRIYNYDTITARDTFINIITMPFSLFTSNFYNNKYIGRTKFYPQNGK